MSWEYSETKQACPCGKGTYTIVYGSNDWGQFSTDWRMDCPSCDSGYALHTFSYYQDAMHNVGHRWVERKKYEKGIVLEQESKKARERALALSKARHFSALEEQFDGKSKKAIWEVLHANIRCYKSLGTFYSHTKGVSKRKYLGELFDQNLEEIIEIAHIKDDEISTLIAAATKLQNEAEHLLRGS